MYLKERIIGLIVFYSLLFLMTFFVSKSNNYKSIKKILIAYVLLLSIMAYFYLPNDSADLSRHFISLKLYSNMSTSDFINAISINSAPGALLYFRIIGKLNNIHLLPCITSFIYYGILFTLYFYFIKNYKINSKSAAFSLFLFMICGRFLGIISGIRNGLAFILIFCAIYREFFLDKKIISNVFLYLIAILIHPAALIIIFLRFLFILFEKNSLGFRIVNLIFLMIMGFVFYKYNYYILDEAINKSNLYLSETTYFYIWEHIISLIYIVFYIITIFIFNKKIKDKRITNLGNFIMIINIFCFIFIYEHSIFTRIQNFSSLLFLFYYMFVLNQLHINDKKMKVYSFLTYVIMFSILIISLTRGNISSLKFFIN